MNLGVDEYGDDFYRVLHDHFTIKVNLAHADVVAPAILSEARRRARLMYGMSIKYKRNADGQVLGYEN